MGGIDNRVSSWSWVTSGWDQVDGWVVAACRLCPPTTSSPRSSGRWHTVVVEGVTQSGTYRIAMIHVRLGGVVVQSINQSISDF